MSDLDLVTVATPQPSHQEMLKDHETILQNYVDSLRARGLSPNTIEGIFQFIKAWFEKIRVDDGSGEHQLFSWEAMKPVAGRKAYQGILMTLSALGDDNQVCLRHTTVRG